MTTNVKIVDLPLKEAVNDDDLVIVQDGNTTNSVKVTNLMKSKADKSSLAVVAFTGRTEDLVDGSSILKVDTRNLTYYYLATAVDSLLADKADKATTLAGYGITDAYTKDVLDTSLASKFNTGNVLSAFQITPDDTHVASEKLVKDNLDLKADSNNVYTKSAMDTLLDDKADLSALTSTNNNVTLLQSAVASLTTEIGNKAEASDVYTKSQTYSTAEVYNKTEADTLLANKANTTDLNNKVDKVTGSSLVQDSKVASYDNHVGDTDIHVTLSEKTTWNNKANIANTLAGYGITDAYISGNTITLSGNTLTPLVEDASGNLNVTGSITTNSGANVVLVLPSATVSGKTLTVEADGTLKLV